MKEVEVRRVVRGSPEQVYEEFVKFAWYQNGGLSKVKIVKEGDPDTHVGSTRLMFGLVHETITTTDPGKSFEYIVQPKGPLKSYHSKVTFQEAESDDETPRTLISWNSKISAILCIDSVVAGSIRPMFSKILSKIDARLTQSVLADVQE